MKYRSAFCTLDAVIRQLAISTSSDNDLAAAIDTEISTQYSNDEARIKELIFDVSEQIAGICDQQFVPYRDTYTRAFQQMRARRELWRNHGVLTLNLHHGFDDLLSVESLVWDSTTLSSSQYRVGEGQYTPASFLELDDTAIPIYTSSNFSTGITLTGVWGYHQNPAQMWVNSGDSVQDNPLSSSATSLTVASGAAFEIYQYLRIESEFVFVTARSGNTLTIERGVNGTTVTEHANDTQIDTLRVHDTAEEAVRRRVVYVYQNPGEHRRIVALPDGSIQLDNEKAIPIPARRWRLGRV